MAGEFNHGWARMNARVDGMDEMDDMELGRNRGFVALIFRRLWLSFLRKAT